MQIKNDLEKYPKFSAKVFYFLAITLVGLKVRE